MQNPSPCRLFYAEFYRSEQSVRQAVDAEMKRLSPHSIAPHFASFGTLEQEHLARLLSRLHDAAEAEKRANAKSPAPRRAAKVTFHENTMLA